MRILQVSTHDIGGGAERVAWNLFKEYRTSGYGSWLAVGNKRTDDPDILPVPNNNYQNKWASTWYAVGNIFSPLVGKVPGVGKLRKCLHLIGQPNRLLEIQRGHEDFDFPGTWGLLDLPSGYPDIVHCHNLHGGYFDLRFIPKLSRQVPVLLTLHDAWLLSGHCAHSFDCERWKIGCGFCPDLKIPPAIKQDATAFNWRRKREIFTKSRLYISTPSRWLMQKVEQSILAPAIVEARVIPNGVDLSIFHPTNKRAIRKALDIPQDAKVLLFMANGIRNNIWKDFKTLRNTISIIAERWYVKNLFFIAVGEDAPSERIGQAEIHFIPNQKNIETVACYYQAADIYVHAARADTFPNTVLEALACGIPVVATAVGGIPEQVEDGITGFLTPLGSADAMALRIEQLIVDHELKQMMGAKAAESARKKFDLEKQTNEYLDWYEKIIYEWQEVRSQKHEF